MNVLKDIFRRKARSVLTITGIGVGVLALVVLGAVAENQNVYVGRMADYFEDMIIVTETEGANTFGLADGRRPLSMETIEELREQPGVKSVDAQVGMLFDDEYVSVIPPTVIGIEGGEGYDEFPLAEGRKVVPRDHGVTALGADLAKQLGAEVGAPIDIRGESFEVIGILERTFVNVLDSAAYVTLADAQVLTYDSLPEAFRATVDPSDLVHQANVYAASGVDPDELADDLERDVAGIATRGPTELIATVEGLVALVNAVVFSIAAIALLIGGLSIVNTMTMSVIERTREIGVKRALGASRRRIAGEIIAESAVMGGLGGVGGLVFGVLIALGLNSAMIAMTGTTTIVVTGRLVIGALLFAIVLGTVGGLYPARYAARLEPAAALAHE